MDLRALSRAAALVLVATGCSERGDRGAAPDLPRVGAAVRYPDHGAAGGALPPADSLVNPVRASAEAALQGQRLFSSMNCDGCHGEGALGFAGPSLVDGRWRYGGEDGAIYQSIFYGRPRGMPAYGGLLQAGTIWQLVTYLQTQPVPAEVPTIIWR